MGCGDSVEIVGEGTWKELMLVLRRDKVSERYSGLTRRGKGPSPGEHAHLRNAGVWGRLGCGM